MTVRGLWKTVLLVAGSALLIVAVCAAGLLTFIYLGTFPSPPSPTPWQKAPRAMYSPPAPCWTNRGNGPCCWMRKAG